MSFSIFWLIFVLICRITIIHAYKFSITLYIKSNIITSIFNKNSIFTYSHNLDKEKISIIFGFWCKDYFCRIIKIFLDFFNNGISICVVPYVFNFSLMIFNFPIQFEYFYLSTKQYNFLNMSIAYHLMLLALMIQENDKFLYFV